MSGLTRVEPEECFNFQEMGTDEVSLGIASHNVRALSSLIIQFQDHINNIKNILVKNSIHSKSDEYKRLSAQIALLTQNIETVWQHTQSVVLEELKLSRGPVDFRLGWNIVYSKEEDKTDEYFSFSIPKGIMIHYYLGGEEYPSAIFSFN
jgi:hypothetical protein